jgi:hypothetical protein
VRQVLDALVVQRARYAGHAARIVDADARLFEVGFVGLRGRWVRFFDNENQFEIAITRACVMAPSERPFR